MTSRFALSGGAVGSGGGYGSLTGDARPVATKKRARKKKLGVDIVVEGGVGK
jgi:hypothetical protein